MTRPLRLEFPGALYHVTARGDRKNAIYCDDIDRMAWLRILARVCERHNFLVHSFCQMNNHYHILIETREANLSHGMRQLNGTYTQHFNRRHDLVGHLFQGRYKAILVQKESYLLEVARYVVLNPVRAKLVCLPDEWQWSSYRYFMRQHSVPDWLHTDWLLKQFGTSRPAALLAFRDFVLAGLEAGSPLNKIRHQLLLGDEAFVSSHQSLQQSERLTERARVQRRASALSLAEYQERYANRNDAMAHAYRSTAFSMVQIAAHFKVSYRTVSRAIAAFEARACN
jgi:REP element-mobilizing transposase RayT